MNGKILTQNSWKVTVVFTLTVLFATTCLLLTNLFAEHDNDMDEDWAFKDHENPEVRQIVWGEAYASTWYDPPFAKSYQYAYVSNSSDEVPIRCYYTFRTTLTGPAAFEPIVDQGDGTAPRNDWWVEATDSSHFRFSLNGKPDGLYTIHASSDLTVKADFDNNGSLESVDGFHASISTDFRKE